MNSPDLAQVIIALIQSIVTMAGLWFAYSKGTTRGDAKAESLAETVKDTAAGVADKLGAKAEALATTVKDTAAGVADKLGEVHTAVNGNLDAEKKKAERYARALRATGIDPDSTV